LRRDGAYECLANLGFGQFQSDGTRDGPIGRDGEHQRQGCPANTELVHQSFLGWVSYTHFNGGGLTVALGECFTQSLTNCLRRSVVLTRKQDEDVLALARRISDRGLPG
jgi:hypothetical protein